MRRALRQVIGALVGFYTLYVSWAALGQVVFRSGFFEFAGWRRDPQPWLDAMPDWQLGLALFVAAMFAASVLGILTGARTFLVYAGAVVLDVILYGFIRLDGLYDAYAPALRQRTDVVMAVGLVLIGAVLWWTERTAARKTAAQRP